MGLWWQKAGINSSDSPGQAWQHGIISAWSPQAGLINTIRQAPANTIHASPAPVMTCHNFETYVKIKLGERKGDRVGGGRGRVVTLRGDITEQEIHNRLNWGK